MDQTPKKYCPFFSHNRCPVHPDSDEAKPSEKRVCAASVASSSSPPQPDLDRCDRVRYACGPDGPLAASRYDEAAHKDTLTCLSCNGCLVFRKTHKRTRAGSEYQVCAHFMHKTCRPASCTNESIDHKCAKAKAAQGALLSHGQRRLGGQYCCARHLRLQKLFEDFSSRTRGGSS
jgi:hypothetical protein